MPTETNAATKDRPFDVGQLCAMGVLVETKLGYEINLTIRQHKKTEVANE